MKSIEISKFFLGLSVDAFIYISIEIRSLASQFRLEDYIASQFLSIYIGLVSE